MSDRSSGYVTDVGYTLGYHPVLNPVNARLPFLRAGLAPPRVENACELGFGQGLSLAVHAAAGSARWWGCDLLPGHVATARALDGAAGSGSVLVEASFAEFAARTDLPPFDFIGLHGVLSWVSAENRTLIAAFLRDRLAPRGVVYTGYNALAGWAEMLPLRRLMADHAARAGTAGDTVARIRVALEFTAQLLDTHPLATRALPGVQNRFERLRMADPRYLAHEYFNRDWVPLDFTTVADLMATAGLRHIAPAQLRDSLDDLVLAPSQRALLAGIADPCLRETVRDFMMGTQVRRDYWARDVGHFDDVALADAWRATRLVLVTPRADIPERVSGPLGELRLDSAAHRTVLDALADHQPRALGTLSGADVLADAAFELAACGHLAVAQDEADQFRATPRALRLNALLMEPGGGFSEADVLASPVTGGGVARGPRPLLAALGAVPVVI